MNTKNIKANLIQYLLLFGLCLGVVIGVLALTGRGSLSQPVKAAMAADTVNVTANNIPLINTHPPAPCAEFTDAFAWVKQTTSKEKFPVIAYFTKHFGSGATSASSSGKDAVHYASGEVFAVPTPTPHLKGTLIASKNTDLFGEMLEGPSLTYDVEIFLDGTLSYLMKINGQPVGGQLATKVQATCVNNVLLTATSGSEVVAVGVARKPSETIAN